MTSRGNWHDYVHANDYLTTNGLIKKVYWSNGKYLGDCVQDVDGYWKFWFRDGMVGAFDGHEFEVLAAMLRDMNHEWDEEIRRYFDGDE